MPWLVCGTRVLANVEVAERFGARLRGLLGRDAIEGTLLLVPARSVHTLGMRFPIDVAWCDRDLVVLRTATVRPHRMTRSVRGAHQVLEAEAGAFARWGIGPGDRLAVRA